MSRAPRLLLLPRAAPIVKLCAALAFSAGCLQSGYVLSERGGSTVGGTDVGGAGGMSQMGGEPAAGGHDAPLAGGAGRASCDGTFQGGLDLAVCTARYWGSVGSDSLTAVGLTAERDVIVGGQSEVLDWGVPTLEVASAGTGLVARLDPVSAEAAAVARVGSAVLDLAVVGERVITATDWGAVSLSVALDAVAAETQLGGVTRIDAAGAYVAVLTTDGRALLLDDDLAVVQALPVAGRSPQDVAVDEDGVVAVTGFRAPGDGAECLGSLPFIDTYDASGVLLWSAYGFDDAPGWCASSQGRRLAIKAGQLYYAGEQEGGNSVHQRDPRDVSLQAPLVSYDTFSTSAGKAIDVYSFVARFDLATGALQTGQVIVPRDADGVGGTLFTTALAVDDSGRLFLGGKASCCLERRAERTVASQSIGPFAAEEPSLLMLSADLRQRLSWTTFTASGAAAANVEGIAVSAGLGVLVGSTSATGELILEPPDASVASGENDGYFVSFPAP